MSLRLKFLAYFFAFFLLGFSKWLGVSFDDPTIDQILYHLHYSDGLGIDVGRIFLLTFAVECILLPLLLAATALMMHVHARRWTVETSRHVLGWIIHNVVPVLTVAIGATALMLQLSVFSWAGAHFAQDRFTPHFVDAKGVALRPVAPRNLVLIYVESLEDAYGDPMLWGGRDLLKPLRDLGGVSFPNLRQSPGTTWTIAAMVGTQCGVPLRVVSHYEFKVNPSDGRTFLPGATCLGTLLRQHGYRNVFLGGAQLSFAGKGKFLHDHGYDTAYGRDEWQKKRTDPKAFNEWGLYDDALFTKAKATLTQLHASGQPFNLTLLTLDTHNPVGFRSPSCRARGIKGFEDIVECTSHQVADFVKFVRQSGYLKNTAIAIVGDHLAVSNPLADTLRAVPDRRVFNLFISEPTVRRNRDDLVSFDLFPTLVEFAGFDVSGGRLGLGYSALNAQQSASSPEGLQDFMQPTLTFSATYRKLWDQP